MRSIKNLIRLVFELTAIFRFLRTFDHPDYAGLGRIKRINQQDLCRSALKAFPPAI